MAAFEDMAWLRIKDFTILRFYFSHSTLEYPAHAHYVGFYAGLEDPRGLIDVLESVNKFNNLDLELSHHL